MCLSCRRSFDIEQKLRNFIIIVCKVDFFIIFDQDWFKWSHFDQFLDLSWFEKRFSNIFKFKIGCLT